MPDEIKNGTEKKEDGKEASKQEPQQPQGPAAPAKDENEAKIAELTAKLDEITDKYLRALAEQDNYRKRVQKDKEDFVKYSRGEAVSIFLPVVDNFERAIAAAEKVKDFGQMKKGIEMVLKQFEGALKELGVREVPVSGHFDPMMHHAMHKEHAEGKKDGAILEVYQKGYMIDDKVIRPAMVKIAHNEPVKKENHEHNHHKEGNHENKK